MSDEPDDLRALLADVPEPDADRRERALAAAMAAFDEQLAPRRRSTRWLMPVAAALIAVVAVGGVITQLGTGDDSATTAAQRQTADRTIAAANTADAVDAADDGAVLADLATVAATEPVTEMMAAEAEEGAGVAPPAPADPAATNIPVARTDAELIDAVRTALTTGEAGLQACNRPIVTSVIDERDASNVRLVLLAVETGASGANADDDGEQMIVVLAPDGDPDACTELDRIALP